MFKVNNKNTRTMSLASLTYFTHFSDDSLADFEQVNVSWEFVKFLFVEILEI